MPCLSEAGVMYMVVSTPPQAPPGTHSCWQEQSFPGSETFLGLAGVGHGGLRGSCPLIHLGPMWYHGQTWALIAAVILACRTMKCRACFFTYQLRGLNSCRLHSPASVFPQVSPLSVNRKNISIYTFC